MVYFLSGLNALYFTEKEEMKAKKPLLRPPPPVNMN